MIRVKDLRKALKGVKGNIIVAVDAEGRCFDAHLIDINNVSLQDTGLEEKVFILFPNTNGTYFAERPKEEK